MTVALKGAGIEKRSALIGVIKNFQVQLRPVVGTIKAQNLWRCQSMHAINKKKYRK